ncbi:hypothetical protein BS78_08G110100 [Paspalum vaginatum]|nr:hypothetical protein BS78_08G110100 [Paspalum vaginatum]
MPTDWDAEMASKWQESLTSWPRSPSVLAPHSVSTQSTPLYFNQMVVTGGYDR